MTKFRIVVKSEVIRLSSVLVSGGMGTIGSWVTRKLIEQGTKVVVYQRSPDTKLLKDIADKFDYVAGDVLDLPKILHTIKQYDVERVIHMVALVHTPLEANPFLYKINVEGTINVFEASRLMGIKRVVYISSKAVYGIAKGEHGHPIYKPINEDYTKAPRTVYGATKLFGENMGVSYNRIYGLDFIALRFASTYGPGKLTRYGAGGKLSSLTYTTHSQIIESAMLGSPLKIAKGGDHVNDMVYNRDVAEGIVLACFTENPKHRFFHLGTGKRETFRHLVEIVNNIFGKELIEVGPGLGTENPCIFDISRAQQELGYSPQYSLEEGVKDYIETMNRLGITPVKIL